jgi:hypothetical protein
MLSFAACEAMGAGFAPGIPCALFQFEGQRHKQPGQTSPREHGIMASAMSPPWKMLFRGSCPSSKLGLSLFAEGMFWTDYFEEGPMKWIIPALAALFLGALSLSIPAPIFSTEASANKMNGKPTCGQMNCMQDRYYNAKRKEAKGKKAN